MPQKCLIGRSCCKDQLSFHGDGEPRTQRSGLSGFEEKLAAANQRQCIVQQDLIHYTEIRGAKSLEHARLWHRSTKAFFEDKKTMAEGTIKRLTDKGFGFINTGKAKDLFFHSSNLDGVTFEQLQEGQRVSYTEGEGPKGPRAENVKLI